MTDDPVPADPAEPADAPTGATEPPGSLNPAPGTPAGDLSARVSEAALGLLELISIRHGHALGLYAALAVSSRPITSDALAATTGTNPRMVREWCEQQAVAGFLTREADAYALTRGVAETFTDPDSLNFSIGTVLEALHVVKYLPEQELAFRTGRGMGAVHPWPDGRPDGNRPKFLRLVGSWLRAAPAVHRRLTAGARVADLGVGSGWSSIAMALAYPAIQVDGFDLDADAIAFGQRHATTFGVSDRVRLLARDAGDVEFAGRYDLVTVFEALHDMTQPVAVLEKLRGMLAAGGSVLVADERVREQLVTPGTTFDRLVYGWSVASCLPRAMTDPASLATGAVMRPETLRRYASGAGYRSVEVLPIAHHEWRFYQLHP